MELDLLEISLERSKNKKKRTELQSLPSIFFLNFISFEDIYIYIYIQSGKYIFKYFSFFDELFFTVSTLVLSIRTLKCIQ